MQTKLIQCFLLFHLVFLNAQTKIIAHRGYWNTNPKTAENSIESLKNAQQLKVYGSEFDVRMSKDSILVVYHDENFGNMNIANTSFQNLRSKKLSNGENIPTLEEYIDQGKKDPLVKLIVELKPMNSKKEESKLVNKVLETIKNKEVKAQCEFISFSLNICKEIKKNDSAYRVSYLAGDLSPKQVKQEGLDGIDYSFMIFMLHPTWIASAKKMGLITNAWTVNNKIIYGLLQLDGIEFVTTNIPNSF